MDQADVLRIDLELDEEVLESLVICAEGLAELDFAAPHGICWCQKRFDISPNFPTNSRPLVGTPTPMVGGVSRRAECFALEQRATRP
ncbi:MAG: hypothetical protein AB7P08_16105 [Burkholderiales bacterium]